MIAELQEIVDALAVRLQRPVAVDDRRLRLQAFSQRGGDVDGGRLAAILSGATPEGGAAWMLERGIDRSRGPVRVPANPDLQLEARVCVPLRFGERLVGYLWIIDEPGTLTDADLALVAELGEAAAAQIDESERHQAGRRDHEQRLLQALLGDEPRRQDAAAELVASDAFVGHGPVLVMVAAVDGTPSGVARRRVALAAGASAARRRLSPRHALHATTADRAIALVSLGDPLLRGRDPAYAGGLLHAELAAALPDGVVRVGVGAAAAGLLEAATSHRQALQALACLPALEGDRDVIAFDELGAYRILSLIPRDRLAEAVPEAVRRLLAAKDGAVLARTAEVYLAHALNVQAAAGELALHRTTLYHRLRRLEQLTDLSLADGDDRLTLELGLRIARMTGGETFTLT